MLRYLWYLVVISCAFAAFGQTTSSAPTVQVELLNSAKTQKLKQGQKIKARTVNAVIVGKDTVIPLGSTVIGQVRAVGSESSPQTGSYLTLAFDQVEMSNGKSLPIKLVALAAMNPAALQQGNQNQQKPQSEQPYGAASPQIQILKGGPLAPHNTPETLEKNPGMKTTGPSSVAAQTGSVIGMPGISLEVTNDPKDPSSTFRSPNKEFELPKGLQLILKAVQ